MMRSLLLVALVAITITFCSCEKIADNNVEVFYGTWTKDTNVGDTLWFMEKNGKPTMKYSASYNPAFPGYTEVEYNIENGKLAYRFGSGFIPMESFAWITKGQKFEITSSELYAYMSSFTQFAFTKIN